MPLRMGLRKAHFNSYHHNTSLLFQFILSEFMISFREFTIINQWLNKQKFCRKESYSESDIKALNLSINQLAGLSQEYMRIFSWNIDNGVLAKLKNYCALFLQNSDYEDKTYLCLHRYADRSWLLCLQNSDLLQALNTESNSLQKKHNTLLLTSLEKMSACFTRLAKVIPEIIKKFKDDENVIFFVLSHKDELDALYGFDFFQKLCKKMYPKGGLEELRNFLYHKYKERGFTNILPKIKGESVKPNLVKV